MGRLTGGLSRLHGSLTRKPPGEGAHVEGLTSYTDTYCYKTIRNLQIFDPASHLKDAAFLIYFALFSFRHSYKPLEKVNSDIHAGDELRNALSILGNTTRPIEEA